MKHIELLSPAGDFEGLAASIANGCDAVYFGGKDFNARKAADNFSDDELEKMIDYCHLHGVKAYITLNTLYLETEFKTLLRFVEKAYSYGADAFIVCDMGLIFLLRYFDKIALHASTQISAHSLSDVLYLESLGFKRVIIARETPLYDTGLDGGMDTINDITQNTSCEIEVFAHGALCVSYSGRCLMSAFFGGRSGNRGDCAQPCRQNYTFCSPVSNESNKYLLSPKDVCTLSILPELIDSGVSSLKIEGRMKGASYCAVTASAYSRALSMTDTDLKSFEDESRKELLQVFNRGGDFTSGYYTAHSGYEMMSPKTPKSTGINIGQVLEYNKKTKMCLVLLSEPIIPGDGIEISGAGTYVSRAANAGAIATIKIEGEIKKGDAVNKTYGKALMDKSQKSYEKDTRRLTINGKVYAVCNERAALTLTYNGIEATAYASTLTKAKTAPVSQGALLERLSKTGDSTFAIAFTDCIIGDDIFISVGEINKLRRDALDLFTEKYLKSFKRTIPEYKLPLTKPLSECAKQKLTVLISSTEQFEYAITERPYIIYVEAKNDFVEDLDYFIKLCRSNEAMLYVALPFIITKRLNNLLEKLEASPIDGYLVRTMGQLHLLSDSEKEITLDYTLNIFNPYAAAAFDKSFAITPSVELRPEEIKHFGDNTEIVAYGKIPLMITRQCPVGNYLGRKENKKGPYCSYKNKEGDFHLLDRKGARLLIHRDCESCLAAIHAQNPIGAKGFTFVPGVSRLRLQFTDENRRQVKGIIAAFKEKMQGYC